MVLLDAVDELIAGEAVGSSRVEAVATAKHLLLEAVSLPSGFIEAVIEKVRDGGAGFEPGLFFDRVQVELADWNSIDAAFSVNIQGSA